MAVYKGKVFREFQNSMSENFDVGNQFLEWYAGYHNLNQADYKDRVTDKGLSADIYMSSMASMRFSVGIDDSDASVVFGIAHDIADSVMSFNWTTVAFLKQIKGVQKGKPSINDWIAFSCPDIRVEDSGSPEPISLRIWFPVATGILDGWSGLPEYPDSIRIVKTIFKKGLPIAEGEDIKTLPLVFKGKWNVGSKIRRSKKTDKTDEKKIDTKQ